MGPRPFQVRDESGQPLLALTILEPHQRPSRLV